MPATLSLSPQKDLFIEFLRLQGKNKQAESFIRAIDDLCDEIAKQPTMPADDSNAFDHLRKMAIGLQSEVKFLEKFTSGIFGPYNKKNKKDDNLKNAYKAFYEFVDAQYTEESFASYMVGRYRLGYEYLALYWAAVLFEQLVERKVKLSDYDAWVAKKNEPGRNGQDPTLDDNIRLLSINTLKQDNIYKFDYVFKHYFDYDKNKNCEMSEIKSDPDKRVEQTRERLRNFKTLRNNVVHYVKLKESMSVNSMDIVYYVWSELLPNSFQDCLERQKSEGKHSIIETIGESEADYMVRAVDETTKNEDETVDIGAIQYYDFEDLYEMRKRLLPLKSHLYHWLRGKHKSTGLTTDIVTTIDTTSAYIWMPLVSYDLQILGRQGIFKCAVSILVTPLDFRVYMDFGGYAAEERFAYFQFLESTDYSDFMLEFTGKDEMKVFDIDWFCFIADISKLESQRAIQKATNIEAAKLKLNDSVLPITWNRLLHGYILEKKNVPDEGITLKWIKERLEWIIQFYKAYKNFKPPMTLEEYKSKKG